MEVIKRYDHVVYMGRGTLRSEMEPGTIYIELKARAALWLCPCGCGSRQVVWYRRCSLEGERYLPEGITAMELTEEGELTFGSTFAQHDCPNHLLYRIEKNEVKIINK